MRLIRQSYEIREMRDPATIIQSIEGSARLCYKSEDRIKPGTADIMVRKLIKSGHHAMLEHGGSITVRFITDRGVTHEIVRHRLCSFAQESTRYCNYSKGKFDGQCMFIIPSWFNDRFPKEMHDVTEADWHEAMESAERSYMHMLENGAPPQESRTVLPNSLKTEIDVTCNIREWRHIMTLRTAPNAHPQMVDLMTPLLEEFKRDMPVLFEDIG